MYRKPEPSRNHPNSCHPPNAQAAGELCVDKTQSSRICNLCVEQKPRPRRARTNSRARTFLIGKSTNDSFSKKKLRPPGICSGATWAGIFFYTEIADLWRLGFIYTEFADAWRLDFIYTEFADAWRVDFLYTEIADTNWSLGDSRGDDIAFVSSQMQAKFRRRFRVVFS